MESHLSAAEASQHYYLGFGTSVGYGQLRHQRHWEAAGILIVAQLHMEKG